jgi:hypothetical protein
VNEPVKETVTSINDDPVASMDAALGGVAAVSRRCETELITA